MSSVHTCLGTPTLGPALPVDIREPLGGMLTFLRGQSQPRWLLDLSRLRMETAMRCDGSRNETLLWRWWVVSCCCVARCALD